MAESNEAEPMFAFADLYGVALDGKYRIGGLLGQGGMGAVFVAEHLGTGRTVAVKTILPQLLAPPEALERFRREARAAGRLRHPNIVDVTDFGVARAGGQDIAYLVMEYLDGMTLRALLDQRGRVEPEVIVPIVEQIALALDAAHNAGMVHRDLKPDNVWLIPDPRGGYTVRVLDFGIAKLRDVASDNRAVAPPVIASNAETIRTPAADTPTAVVMADGGAEVADEVTAVRSPAISATARIDSQPLTVSGSTLGTPAYMSPEQCRGEAVDLRSDIYSLGVLTYEAIAGRRPFTGNFKELIDAHLHAVPDPLDRVAGVSTLLSTAVLRALSKSPEERYPSAPAMAGSLYAAVEGPTLVLRRATALYSDHLPLFLGIAFAAFRGIMIPYALFTAAILLLSREAAAPVCLVAAIACWGLMTTMTNASFAVALDLLRTRPLERLTTAEVLRELAIRSGVPGRPGGLLFTLRLSAFYVKCELSASPGAGDIAFLITFLERLPREAINERCKLLIRGAGARYSWLRGAFLPPLLILPAVQACVLYVACRILHIPHADDFAVIGAALLMPANAIFFNPILSAALVLLYFRSRQANGEDVRLASLISSPL